mmetsp:Transcript_22646/g.50370  ORF Transcript_22646/g.50370 Transcript_22646/m.50370 type:complete len:108 (+) Transcript_22646:2-325(+)
MLLCCYAAMLLCCYAAVRLLKESKHAWVCSETPRSKLDGKRRASGDRSTMPTLRQGINNTAATVTSNLISEKKVSRSSKISIVHSCLRLYMYCFGQFQPFMEYNRTG